MGKVIYEFDSDEERDEIMMHTRASDMYCALHDIYNIIRTEFKHGDEELSQHVDRLLEEIQRLAAFVMEF